MSVALPALADEPPDAEREAWARPGVSYSLGGGVDILSFWLIPTGALATLEGSLNVGLSRGVDFRLTGLFGIGAGVSDSAYVTALPGVRAAFRFSPVPRWSMWAGYEGRLGVAAYVTEDNDPVGALPLHGPSVSIASFRFGSRGQFEFDHDGGVFLPPIWGYHSALVARYFFER